MLSRFIRALAVLAFSCALAFAQGSSTMSIPANENGASVVAWSSQGLYQQGDVVSYTDGCSYTSRIFQNTSTPSATTAAWLQLGCGSSTLAASGITAGTYGSATQVGSCTFNAQGIAINCVNTAISFPSSSGGTTNYLALSNAISPASAYDAFGDSITCGWIQAQGNAAGSAAPYKIDDPGCNQANGYPYLIAAQTGATTIDNAIPGDESCDVWPRQIGPQSVSPSLASPLTSSLMIGTNDANLKGTGANEVNFNKCQLAVLEWLAVPLEYKVLPAAATSNNGWTLGSNASGAYALGSGAGAAITFTITTYGGPIYLWHGMTDGQAGSATYSVDGGSSSTIVTAPATNSSTANGTTNTVSSERIMGVAAGTHTLTLTMVSGYASVYGVGTPSGNSYYQHPVVAVGSVPLPQLSNASYGPGSAYYAAMLQYTADTLANVTELQGDGLDIRYASDHNYLLGSNPEYTDYFHVSPLGAQHLASAFESVLQIVPARSAGAAAAAANASAAGAVYPYTGRIITGSSTVTASDVDIYGDCSSACTLTLPAMPTGQHISVMATGSAVTIAAGSGIVVNGIATPFTIPEGYAYSFASFTSTNWSVTSLPVTASGSSCPAAGVPTAAEVTPGATLGSGGTAVLPSGFFQSNCHMTVVATAGSAPSTSNSGNLFVAQFSTAFPITPACTFSPLPQSVALIPYATITNNASQVAIVLSANAPLAASASVAYTVSCSTN